MSALAEFATHKKLPLDYVQGHGLTDDRGGIRIANGDAARARVRKRPQSAHPTYWESGDQRPMRVFGQSLLEKMAAGKSKSLFIVEGESDALTLWWHRRAALGVPGATMTHVLAREDVAWADRVVIIREPGDAGAKFVVSAAKRLREVGFSGEIVQASLNPHKDASDLHIAVNGDRTKFGSLLDDAVGRAVPAVIESETAKAGGLGVLTDDDLIARATDTTTWLVEGLLPAAGLMLMSARPKVGKSELARVLAKAVATGAEFLGRRCLEGKVVWVGLEESAAHLRDRIEALGLLGLGIQWVVERPAQDETKWLRDVVARYKPDLLVIDTIARLLRIEDVNSYSEVARATQIMLDLRSEFGTAFVAIHHNNRADSTLGSVQWEAFCDTIMLLTRSPQNERFVRTTQRNGTDMESALLERDDDTGWITIAESKAMADQRAAEERILRYMSTLGRPATREEMARHCGRLIGSGRAAVDALVAAGLLKSKGTGTRSDPRLYEVVENPESSTRAQARSMLGTESNNVSIQLVEDSDPSEGTPRRSEDSEPSEDSDHDLMAYANGVFGDDE